MPTFGTTPPPPQQQDVPAHHRTIDFANDVGAGFKKQGEIKDNTQEIQESVEHEGSQQDVSAEHYDVPPEQQRLESPEQWASDEINRGTFGEGFQVADSTAEQSIEEEYEMEM